MIFKCKMCGGDLEIKENSTVCECEYCGTTQTLPKIDNDRRANLYDRANHFRRNNEFDKAMGIYEQILNDDGSDAEAYWSIVLCRYGIEYVEDPTTHKRVPTVNRAQFTSIFDDANYQSALEHADSAQREVYKAEAEAINEIQKGILEISSKEEPFDVFICYKETDNNGRRTPDSVLANDLYHQLTQEGFKVFFARITLEDKLGSAYEPYIFAALNSAKVMVVLGTKPEYFNAVWVKNEWSRYLALIKSGAKKMIIPAYKDMDPYDLPEEFSHLQAQDMAKLGFMQDLIRGIKKITAVDEPKVVKHETVVVQNEGNSNITALLKRAKMALEDGEFAKADDFCEQVLNQDAENADAYLYKLYAEFKIINRDKFRTTSEFVFKIKESKNYKKAHNFGKQAELDEDINEILYNQAIRAENKASSEKEYKNAAESFGNISGYKDSNDRKKLCLEKAEISRKDAAWARADKFAREDNEDSLKKAIREFEELFDYKDSDDRAEKCKNRLQVLISEREEHEKRLAEAKKQAQEKAEKERLIAAEKAKKTQKISAIVGIAAVLVISGILVTTNYIIPNAKYNEAVSLMESDSYEEAISVFERLGEYKDSQTKLLEAQQAETYISALALLEKGSYDEAMTAFEGLGDYRDSVEKLLEIKYNKALKLMENGSCDEALAVFENIKEYKDSASQISELKYTKASELMEKGSYDEAVTIFKELGEYKDSADKVSELQYNNAMNLIENESLDEAYEILLSLGEYKNSIDIPYNKAIDYLENGSYDEAVALFKRLGDYKDAMDIPYNKALKFLENESYYEASVLFSLIGDYKDSQEKMTAYSEKMLKAGQINAGDIIVFGNYYWYVLEITDHSAMIITKDCVEQRKFGSGTWKTCSLRHYLNGEFFKGFSDDEKSMIKDTTIKNKTYIDSGWRGVKKTDEINTTDKVFILSLDEFKEYSFPKGTSFHEKSSSWWLRSTRENYLETESAYVVDEYGAVSEAFYSCDSEQGVRPVVNIQF